jgi:hypothetical protein
MKAKLLFAILLSVSIWYGMTQWEGGHADLMSQSETYVEKHQRFLLRYFGKALSSSTVSVQPQRLGDYANSEETKKLWFRLTNIGPKTKDLQWKVVISPEESASYIRIEPHFGSIKDITPRQTVAIDVQVTISEDMPKALDILHVTLETWTNPSDVVEGSGLLSTPLPAEKDKSDFTPKSKG